MPMYFEAFDTAVSGITNRFNQPGYAIYKNLEELLVNAARGKNYEEFYAKVVSFYKDDLTATRLSVQFQNLGTWFSSKGSTQATVQLSECIAFLRGLSDGQRSFFSEVCYLVRLILVMPATNAISERSFSAMRRLKTYLRSSMGQKRLNHLMLLHLNKEKLDSLDLDAIGNEFVQGSEHRLRIFGKF